MQQQNLANSFKNGRYTRQEKLGQGTCGAVYKGFDTQQKMVVAIKIQSTMDQHELQLMRKFEEYYKTMGFNNVINIYEVIQEPRQIILIMDYAQSGDLFNYQQTVQKQNQAPIKDIMLQIANGLRELHQLNYVHRDMKPENILVSYLQNGQPCFKVADFGLSKLAANTQTTKIGTPYYMAPELIKQNQKYGFEVDIWALGCIYYELITGVNLFQGKSVEELMKKINDAKQDEIDKKIDLLSKYNIIERERKLLKLMISINPQRRPKIMDVVQTLTGSDTFINEAAQRIVPIVNPSQPQPYPQQPIKIVNPNQLQPQIPPQINYQKPNGPQPINYQQQSQWLEQQQTNQQNKILKEYEEILKQKEIKLKQQNEQELDKQLKQLQEQVSQQQQLTAEDQKKQLELLQNNLKIESDRKFQEQLERQRIDMQEQMEKQINESKMDYENRKQQLEAQIQQFYQAQIKQINSYIQEYNEFTNQIEEIQKQLNQFPEKNQMIDEEFQKLNTYFQTNKKLVDIMSDSQDQTQISKNIEAIQLYIKQLNEQIQNIKLNIQNEQNEQKQNKLKQQLKEQQDQIKKDYDGKLIQQEENLKQQIKVELEKQQKQLEEQFKQQQYISEDDKQKQQELLKQQNYQLQVESEKKLKEQQEKQRIYMQEQMEKQINESRVQYENQKKQLESQLRKFQETQTKYINSYIQDFKNFEIQIKNIQSQLNQNQNQNEQINSEFSILHNYFQTKLIDVNRISQSQDYTQISVNIEAIKQYINQLNEYIQNIQLAIKLNIQKQEYEQSGTEQKQILLNKLESQFQQSKEDLREEMVEQMKNISNEIQDKNYLEQMFSQDIQQLKIQYEQEIRQLSQFYQFQDYEKVEDQIQLIKQKSKQLRKDCQKITEEIKKEIVKQNELQNKEAQRYQSQQKQQIENQQNKLNQIKQQQFQDLSLQILKVEKLIQEMESLQICNDELKNQLITITQCFKKDFARFQEVDRDSISSESISSMISQSVQINTECIQLKAKMEVESQQIKTLQQYKDQEVKSFLEYIAELQNKNKFKDQTSIQDYEQNFNNSLQELIKKYIEGIEEIKKAPQTISIEVIQTQIKKIQDLTKQMKSDYSSIETQLTNTKIIQQTQVEFSQKSQDEVKQFQNKELQSLLEVVRKIISDMKLSIQDFKLLSEYKEIVGQFEGIEKKQNTDHTIETLTNAIEQLKQLNTKCQQIQRQQETKTVFNNEVQSYLSYLENLRNKFSSINQQQNMKEFETKYYSSLQILFDTYQNQIQQLANKPQPTQQDIVDIQSSKKQMQYEYEAIQNQFVSDQTKNTEILQQQVQEKKNTQLQAFQSQKDSVIKLISELEQINIQNDEDDNLLNEVKSRFKENFAQFEQIEQNNYSSQQLSEKTQLLNQLHSQCKELQGKAQMEVKQMQKQVEQVKEEFQVEVQAQLQKIENQSKDLSIDPYLKQDIERINQKYKDQLQQNNEHKGSDSLQQRITNIKNTKQQLMTECNSIIEKLFKISSQSNSANQYLNQAITNYRSKLDKAIETITERLPYIQQILTELKQLQSKTNEISNLIQNLQKYSEQYTGQLSQYQELKQKQFDQTQFAQIQEDSENVIKEQGKIETEFQYLQKQYSQVCEQYKTHLINKIVATKPQLENQYLIQELIKEKKNSMNNRIAHLLKEGLTEKTQEECDKILEETLQEQKLLNDSQQFIHTVETIRQQYNTIEQKSFSDIDKDLEQIDQQVRNMQQYTKDLKESQEKDLEVLEQAIRYIKKNPKNYALNQVKLRKLIKDQALIRKILQIKDQSIDNKLILIEAKKAYDEIKKKILKKPEK